MNESNSETVKNNFLFAMQFIKNSLESLYSLKHEHLFLLHEDGWRFSATVVISYVIGVVWLLPRLFKDRKPLDLKFLSMIWNFGLFAYRYFISNKKKII
jgi:hypothetical protein